MNTSRKFYLHIISGGLALVLIAGGILWLFVEITPESALSVVGGIIAFAAWFQTREDKKDQTNDNSEIISAANAQGEVIRHVIVEEHKQTQAYFEQSTHVILKELQNLGPSQEKLELLQSMVSHQAAEKLAAIQKKWNEGDIEQILDELSNYRNNSKQWDEIAPPVQAQWLRTEAILLIEIQRQTEKAKELLIQAKDLSSNSLEDAYAQWQYPSFTDKKVVSSSAVQIAQG